MKWLQFYLASTMHSLLLCTRFMEVICCTVQIMLALGGSKTLISEDGVAVDVDGEVS